MQDLFTSFASYTKQHFERDLRERLDREMAAIEEVVDRCQLEVPPSVIAEMEDSNG